MRWLVCWLRGHRWKPFAYIEISDFFDRDARLADGYQMRCERCETVVSHVFKSGTQSARKRAQR